MKKIAIILLLTFFSSISLAHIGHYNKFDKIEMEILRNDEVIGYNNYFFKRDGEKTIVKNQYKFEVKLLSATIFKVEGYGEEIYLKDNLISFQSKTLQNKKEKFVSLKLDKNKKKFNINQKLLFCERCKHISLEKIVNQSFLYSNYKVMTVYIQLHFIMPSAFKY